MATLLNIGFLQHFETFLVFLLVYILVYVSLKPKLKEMSAIVAFIVAIFTASFAPVAYLIQIVAPWLIVLLVLLFLAAMVFLFAGFKMDDIVKSSGIKYTLVILAVVIVLFGLAEVSNKFVDPDCDPEVSECSNYATHVQKVMFNPQVLGAFFVLILAGLAMLFLTD